MDIPTAAIDAVARRMYESSPRARETGAMYDHLDAPSRHMMREMALETVYPAISHLFEAWKNNEVTDLNDEMMAEQTVEYGWMPIGDGEIKTLSDDEDIPVGESGIRVQRTVTKSTWMPSN